MRRLLWPIVVFVICLPVALLATDGPARGAAPGRPDVVVFLADDLGWADGSPFGGGGARTPNDEGLAAERALRGRRE